MSLATASMTKNADSTPQQPRAWPSASITSSQLPPIYMAKAWPNHAANTATCMDKLGLVSSMALAPAAPVSMSLSPQQWPQAWTQLSAPAQLWPQAQMPAVDMMVLPCNDSAQESKADVVKVSYTSAEDLADALFPINNTVASEMHVQMLQHKNELEDLSSHRELVHEALLDHRDQVQGLKSTVTNLSKHHKLVHDALLDHKDSLVNLHSTVSLVDEGLRDHKKHIQTQAANNGSVLKTLREQGTVLAKLEGEVKALSAKSKTTIEQNNAITKLQNDVRALHKTSDDMHDGLQTHKKFLENHAQDINMLAESCQNLGSVCSSMSSSCLRGQVRFGGGVLLFILGSSLGGVGPVRGLWGGGRGGWCEEWARSG
jgi:hypothetical protein